MEELDSGWSWLVLAASFCYFMVFGMFLYGIGVVHEVLLDEYGGKMSATAWAGSFGGGVGYTATMVVVGFNFRRWRNTALGIAISGVGVGTCILSPVMEIVRGFYGNAGYFIILAAIGVHKCLFAVLCRPSRLELARQESLKNENQERTYMIFLHLPTFAISRGSSRMTASLLLSACGLSTIFARLLTTLISERKNVDGIVLYSGSFGLLALATFLFPIYSRTFPGLVIFSVILGAYFGGCYAVMNSINIHLVGVKYLSIATGMELVFSAVGTAIGPVITGEYGC
ncbi:MOT2-like protein [Mya arenaria]|uniref:MOT2-like protein n=1 Tax=Mya arenaria TaxID=6604 RepID=A0ABY7FGX8_MYAAR|nr:MOT2-like protein [Mya arenaria]